MIVNKLAKEIMGENYDHNQPERCSGKSTAKALAIISQAMSNPGIYVKVSEENCHENDWGRRGFISLTLALIKKLELKHWRFNNIKQSLVFEIYEEVPETNGLILDLLRSKLALAINEQDLEAIEIYSKAIQRVKTQ